MKIDYHLRKELTGVIEQAVRQYLESTQQHAPWTVVMALLTAASDALNNCDDYNADHEQVAEALTKIEDLISPTPATTAR